jgi:hypothetical protein
MRRLQNRPSRWLTERLRLSARWPGNGTIAFSQRRNASGVESIVDPLEHMEREICMGRNRPAVYVSGLTLPSTMTGVPALRVAADFANGPQT